MTTQKRLMTNWRWWIVMLLFLATTVNYMDRQVLSLTWNDFIAPEFHWTDNDYGTITALFSLIYAVCMLFAGKFVDWMGTKKGYLWAIGIWSAGACLHAVCGYLTCCIEGYESIQAMKAVETGSAAAFAIASTSVWLFIAARAILALGEAGNFPAAIKTTAEYFPKKDRAFATSIFNAGASVGALIAPVTIPPLAQFFKLRGIGGGWEMAFLIIGAIGFVWMGLWIFMYDKPEKSRHVNAAELEYIRQDDAADRASATGSPESGSRDAAGKESAAEKSVPLLQCFRYRQTWAFITGKALTDGVWWFFLFWAPAYFSDQFGYASTSRESMLLLTTLYAIVTVVSIFGGYLPRMFVDRKKMNPYAGRMLAMLIFAFFPLLALFAQPMGVHSAWWPAIFIGLAGAGHQAWSANLFSTIGDMFPKSAVATVTGIGGMAGGIGCAIVQKAAGMLFTRTEQLGSAFTFLGFEGKEGGYFLVFCICGLAYLAAWLIMKALVPAYKPIRLD